MVEFPRNVAQPRTPHWTGKDGEYAIVVSRGEPRRTNRQVEQTVAHQVEQYMAVLNQPIDRLVLATTVQLIAADKITPRGSQGVTLTKEHLLAYVDVAKDKIGTLRKGDGRA